MDALDFQLAAQKATKYRKQLKKMRAATASSHDSVLRLIDAQDELTSMIEKNPEMKLFDCLETILNENAKLKALESVEYVRDLEEENALLRDLQGMSPVSRIRPPLPKPNQLAFWSKGRDIADFEADIAKQGKALETVEGLLGDLSIPTKARHLLSRARTVIDASRVDNENKISDYHSYVATCKRKREEDGDA